MEVHVGVDVKRITSTCESFESIPHVSAVVQDQPPPYFPPENPEKKNN